MPMSAFNPKYMPLVNNDAAAAVMLSQIVYWYLPTKAGKPKLQVLKGGMWWIAKSYQEWQEESGLTVKQARRCVSVLRIIGLIETFVFKFNGSPTLHLRLLVAKGANMIKKVPSIEELSCAPQGILICPPEAFPFAHQGRIHLPPEGISLTETTAEITSEDFKDGEQQHSPENDQETPVKTAAEILEARKNAKNAASGDPTKRRAATHWRDRMIAAGAKTILPLSMADLGMFKRLEKDLGQHVHGAIDFAWDNWWKFSQEVKAQGALVQVPPVPQLGFTLKYRQILADLYLQSIAKPKSAVAPFVKVPVPAPHLPVVKPVDSEAPYTPTPEEIAATMALFEGN